MPLLQPPNFVALQCIDTGPFWIQGHRNEQSTHCALGRNSIDITNQAQEGQGQMETEEQQDDEIQILAEEMNRLQVLKINIARIANAVQQSPQYPYANEPCTTPNSTPALPVRVQTPLRVRPVPAQRTFKDPALHGQNTV